jgi:hypothetical protein
MSDQPIVAAGLTTRDVARRYRVSEDRVRRWIKAGELKAINTSDPLCRPRWVVPPEALADFERSRTGGPPPKQPQRRRRLAAPVDYFPDL